MGRNHGHILAASRFTHQLVEVKEMSSSRRQETAANVLTLSVSAYVAYALYAFNVWVHHIVMLVFV